MWSTQVMIATSGTSNTPWLKSGSAEKIVRYVELSSESMYSAYVRCSIEDSVTVQTVRSDDVKTVVAWRQNPSSASCSIRECSRESWIGRRKS